MTMPGSTSRPYRGPAGRIPVVAIVDAWNFRSQVRAAFGQPRHATVDGIIGAFRPYGFEVVEVCFALGVEPASGAGGHTRPPSGEFAQALRRNVETKLRWETDSRARVLAGRLTDASGGGDGESRPAEKMVDVLCAVEICRLAVALRDRTHPARGMICLSKDMDLIPAYRYAEEIHVPVWAAARDTVHRRRDEHRWLLLDDAAIAAASSLHDPFVRDRRRLVAETVSPRAPTDPAKKTMVVDYVDRARETVALRGAVDGLPGSLQLQPMASVFRKGQRLGLWAAGVHVGSGRDTFPVVAFDLARPHRPPGNLEIVRVDRWIDQTSVRVRVGGTHRRLPVPVGSVIPGEYVLVHTDHDRIRYIGPVVGDRARSAAGFRENPTTVRVIRPSLEGEATAPEGRRPRLSRAMRYCLAVAEANNQPVALMHDEHEIHTGDRFPVLLADPRFDEGSKMPLVMQVGSRLPG